jgi:SAM-dependent methyltransferase
MNNQELIAAISKHRWYHRIEVRPGIFTTPEVAYTEGWDFISRQMQHIDFKDKEVIDVGCRDGLFAFQAEKAGALGVHAFDNNLSNGAVDLLIPEMKSKVDMVEASLYETPPRYRNADIVMLFGVLYHLRFPVNGLKCALEFLKIGGFLLIETALLDGQDDLPLLYCPYHNSPYEKSSVSFYNEPGLRETLDSMNCAINRVAKSELTVTGPDGATVRRCWLECCKLGEMAPDFRSYWTGVHSSHSD